jgi:hypothetical protein
MPKRDRARERDTSSGVNVMPIRGSDPHDDSDGELIIPDAELDEHRIELTHIEM